MEPAAPPPSLGLRHLALFVDSARFDAVVRFYRDGMGMRVDWEPDPDNVYLTSGADNLALHRARPEQAIDLATSPLDHLGFCMPTAAAVEAWYAWLRDRADDLGLPAIGPVKRHRDGATSFYFRDPAGHQVQMIHIPSIER
ncbi:MAG: VOC family protein [Nannocystaceae bacterium]